MNPEWAFLLHLFELGRDSADKWLAQHFDDIGQRETVDIRGLFGELGATHVGYRAAALNIPGAAQHVSDAPLTRDQVDFPCSYPVPCLRRVI